MINPIKWYKRRKRATKIGYSFVDEISGKPVYYWHDPNTDTVWMATKRYSHFAIKLDGTVTELVNRLDLDATAVLEVDYREYQNERQQVEA